jgi:phosphopantothenate-cysteine ligase/phosphopantothenoylcysteine decarboxylase/phosphopantothenate--cysteine ligase
MKILVTAGNTQAPIDKVRCITNIFTGRTGTRIALEAHSRGHAVCLLTSHPDVVREIAPEEALSAETWRIRVYRTFDDLRRLMTEEIPSHGFDAVIHCAAVNDYSLGGIYIPTTGSAFDLESFTWRSAAGPPALSDVSADKVKSHHDEIWLRLVRAPKLIDMIRTDWGFRGILVKFKLEVGVSESQLMEIARLSRRQSDANLIVANTLEGMAELAYFNADSIPWEAVRRPELASRLLDIVESFAR